MMANPIYRQIAEDLRQQINSGALQPGSRLRTESELQQRYGASRNTVRDAIKWLTSLGLVETRPGQGTYVVEKVSPFVTTLTTNTQRSPGDVVVAGEGTSHTTEVVGEKKIPSNPDPQVEIQKANPQVAAELQIEEGSPVISRHQRREIDGVPWSLQTSFYPRKLADQGAMNLILADNIPVGAVRYLTDTLGLRQVGYRDKITVRTPDSTEAAFFNLPQDGRVQVFEIFRTAFDQAGKPMRLTVTVAPTDRNQFVVVVGDVPIPQPGGESPEI
jgi:GntR family transcriptional regulator